jgi:phospho-N-acetylmuramoyl-pentapeptide-transferase
MITDFVKIFAPATFAFIVGIVMTPLLTHYLYKYKLWKKKAGKGAGVGGGTTPIFDALHAEREVGVPRFGGIIVWGSVLIVAGGFFALKHFFSSPAIEGLSFISRGQTWLPLAVLAVGAFVGLIDDAYEVSGNGDNKAGGLSLRKRLFIVALIALGCGWWFYTKLEVSTIMLPLHGVLFLGPLLIPLFVLVALCMYAGGVIDGIDGLAGGLFASMFAAYAGITFFENQIDLAAFCATVAGALLAFLWFNIPPARYYLSETGTMGLTLSLTVVAFLSDSLGGGVGVFTLPIIAFPLVVTVLSVVLQVFYKRVLHRKLLLVAPLHHHFEAIGWPSYKVTMRYWIVGVVLAILGMIIALVG